MQKKSIFITIVLLCRLMASYATDSLLLKKSYYANAKQALEDMLLNKQAPSFERAIYLIENAYYENKIAYSDFEKIITNRLQKIQRIAATAQMPERKVNFLYELAQQSPEQYAVNFKKLSNNWAIYQYMTDTTIYAASDSMFFFHLPYRYSTSDPMGTIDWRNTQVLNLLLSKKGNCFALASLYKIFADRLQTDATLCTVPNHIYITHKDENGTQYNVDLGSRSFPGLGTLATFSYATRDAIINGIAPRTLTTQQAISLCLVYLAKGYEYKFDVKDDFMLQCAEKAIKYDSLNLNALLLKAELLENKLLQQNKTVAQLQTINDFKQYEKLIAHLYQLGYREMPTDMKNILVNGWTKDTTQLYLNNNLVQSKTETRKASLSWGLFDETHKYKPTEQYAQTLFDCKTKTIKAFTKEKPIYNNYNFDPVVFAWNIDPLAHQFPGMSPYMAFADNPILYIDEDGKKFVWNKLTADQTTKLSENLKVLNQDKLFAYVYNKLNNSPQEYTLEYVKTKSKNPAQYTPAGQCQGGKIQFDLRTELQDEYTLEEFFHAFQDDNGGINKDVSTANVEYEAKLFTYTTQSRSGYPVSLQNGTVESFTNIVYNEFSDNLTSKDLASIKFQELYKSGVKDFSEFWKTNDVAKLFPGYQQAPSNHGPYNLSKVIKETEANNDNIVGPRLDNGDFYSN